MPTTRELANAIRILAIDAIQKADSGHPGMPLGMADIATVLWKDFLHHDPSNPKWPNRDRFILSNGHGSMLQYALLHLTGYDLSMDELKRFRQLHSKTPGHPEYGLTPGIEATTGPLGQGLANGVGMAIAEKILAAKFNRPDFNLIDHFTYVFAGDGCLMEGISHEACSLAGTLKLGKLIVFWDDNKISIDGHTEEWFTDNVPERFKAYGWHVIPSVDGYDADALKKAIMSAQNVKDQPSIICCKTIIGFGAPNVCGKHDCHGSPLGQNEVAATRENLHWQYPAFTIPDEIYSAWDARARGKDLSNSWQQLFNAYKAKYPELAQDLSRRLANELPQNWHEYSKAYIEKVNSENASLSTRQASQNCIENYAKVLPELFGGSADLTPSVLTAWSGSKDITGDNSDGNYLHYGVREFGMFAIMNGMAVHGCFIPYGGTFLVFTDYGRNAIRLAALSKYHSIFVLTHDSIGLGEDGPTHQPIEQLASLRLIPNLSVWRPCDTVETANAWQYAIEHKGPTCLILTRQKVAAQNHSQANLPLIKKGGYILLDCSGTPDVIIIATGSEIELAVLAAKELKNQNKKIRVVSMPSCDVFASQPESYRESVLPSSIKARVAIEAGVPQCWYQYIDAQHGKVIGITKFGESAPAKALFVDFGFTVEHVVKTVLTVIDRILEKPTG